MTMTIQIPPGRLTLEQLQAIHAEPQQLVLDPAAHEAIRRSAAVVQRAALAQAPTYGVNTGFGKLANQRIDSDALDLLQLNLIRSHSVGVGEPLAPEVVRLMVALKAASLARGHSGVRPEVVQMLLAVHNAGLVPYVPSQGSVGASGDLAPLEHMTLALLGEGEMLVEGRRRPAAAVLREAGLQPLKLAAKEGLALINGTQFMAAVAALVHVRAGRLARAADAACALSLEALQGSRASFLPEVHELRPLPGQKASAANVLRLVAGSAVMESHRWCDKVQDAYSLRCAPQVHGASRDLLAYAEATVAVELNAATDNPLVFAADGELVSNGNFHGQPLAFALDAAAMALAELASISERRVERLTNPSLSDGLPAFLTHDGGLNSGFMIPQYVAASLVSENKVLCHPAGVDSIPTSAGQEDHVSMGNASGLKCLQVIANAERALAIELLAGAQGVEFLAPLEPGAGVRAVHDFVRSLSPTLIEDRPLADDIEAVASAIASGELDAAVARGIGPLA